MPLYLCRWPNGDCSVVQARNRRRAIIQLDEIDAPDDAELSELPEFAVTFQLGPDGYLSLKQVEEETEGEIVRLAYPLVDAAWQVPDDDPVSSLAWDAQMAAAVGREYARIPEDWTTEAIVERQESGEVEVLTDAAEIVHKYYFGPLRKTRTKRQSEKAADAKPKHGTGEVRPG